MGFLATLIPCTSNREARRHYASKDPCDYDGMVNTVRFLSDCVCSGNNQSCWNRCEQPEPVARTVRPRLHDLLPPRYDFRWGGTVRTELCKARHTDIFLRRIRVETHRVLRTGQGPCS